MGAAQRLVPGEVTSDISGTDRQVCSAAVGLPGGCGGWESQDCPVQSEGGLPSPQGSPGCQHPGEHEAGLCPHTWMSGSPHSWGADRRG